MMLCSRNRMRSRQIFDAQVNIGFDGESFKERGQFEWRYLSSSSVSLSWSASSPSVS
jgi:hypothetical protein